MNRHSDDEWAIHIDEQFLFNAPGESAREKQRELEKGKKDLRRFAERLVDARTDARSWRRGAEGEEEVARHLAKLPTDRWAVVHDLTIGARGANLDHLVIGPPGVFALNTKHLTGRVTVYQRAFLQNGKKRRYLWDSQREAEVVQERLGAAVGRPVHAWGVIVVMGCELDIRQRPAVCSVVGRKDVRRWFERNRNVRLGPGDVLELERAARTPTTWGTGQQRRPKQPAPPTGRRVELPPPARRASPPVDDLCTRRWRRYGHDRWYVNDQDGKTLGYLDVKMGEVHVDTEADRSRVVERLRQDDRLS